MRKTHTVQTSIFDLYSDHDIGRELKALSNFLHRDPEVINLGCALLKQMRELSYQELAFHLSDSASFQAFARQPQTLFSKSRRCKMSSTESAQRHGSVSISARCMRRLIGASSGHSASELTVPWSNRPCMNPPTTACSTTVCG